LFFCHYESAATVAAAFVLRILGRRMFIMNDSKVDDKQRWIGKELLKSLFFIPYNGALAASRRSAEYLKFLAFSRRHVVLGYDVISIERMRAQAQIAPAPDGAPFGSRHFTVIARFVPKKNLFSVLDAFSLYVQQARRPRALHLCGSGPLEPQLREKVKELSIDSHVVFQGLVDSAEISRTLGHSLALILVSTEEQFGLVVIEAQAMGVPVIVSPNSGARDELVRTGVNGFLVEPDNPKGIAYFMGVFDEDEPCWTRMASAAQKFVPLGDAPRFARACQELISGSGLEYV
jgi:glycosyltransferase involved in cell wall biosynthesis